VRRHAEEEDMSATPSRFTLPQEWCGAEIEGFPTDDGLWVDVVVGGVASTLPRDLLTPVPPPLPEEPTALGWYLDDSGNVEIVTERQSDGWWFPAAKRYIPAGKLYEECPGVKLTRLVPSTPPEPVELPWQDGPFGVELRDGEHVCSVVLRHFRRDAVMVMTPARARAVAAALLSAAGGSGTPPSAPKPVELPWRLNTISVGFGDTTLAPVALKWGEKYTLLSRAAARDMASAILGAIAAADRSEPSA
jgi:hypothetical protein